MAEGNNFIIDIIAKLQTKISQAQLNGDIKAIQKDLDKLQLKAEIDPRSIKDLQKRIETIKVKAELDPNAVQNITKQLENIAKQRIVISDINIDQGQAAKSGQTAGKAFAENLNHSLSASLNTVKQNIANVLNGIGNQKLNSYDLSKLFNLNRTGIDSSVIQQVRSLTNELNTLAKEALNTNSDNAWEGITNKIGKLSDVLNQFGKSRDLSSFKESLDILNHFQGKKIFVDNKSELLQNTGMGVRELNNQFRNLGVTFTTVSKNASHLDTIWSELFHISPGLEQFTTFGDQISAVVNHLKTAKEAMYGDGGLKPLNGQEVTNVLLDWMANLENASKKLSVLRSEQSEIEQQIAQSSTYSSNIVVQNEERKQQSYRQTSRELNALNNFKLNTLPQIQNNVSNGFYTDQVQQQIEKYNRLGMELPNVKARVDELKAAEQELNSVMGSENSTIEQQMSAYQKFQSALRSANASNNIASNMYMTRDAVDGLIVRLQAFLQSHTNMTETAKTEINSWIEKLQQGSTVLKSVGNDAVASMKKIEAEQRNMSNTGNRMTNSLKNSFSFLSYWTSSAYLFMQAVSKIRQAFSELKEINTITTEISKVSEMTSEELDKLGSSSFETASKYGRAASDYLKGVQEMNRAGFQGEVGENMAELSVLAQAAGDLDANLANDYLIASDAAYGYAGNIERLTSLLDSQNMVTNKNAVSMEELARATKVAANQLSNANISENEMTALLGTGIATSREAGETVGRAVKGIVMNLQQVKGETGFEGEIIDEESLKKVEARCHSVGVELEYMKDGMARLRQPTEVLKELAEVYNSLPDDSADKAGIIADIGGKYRGNVLSSILSNWDKYEKMLTDYASGSGSAMNEAMKSANNWEGSLNRLHNTWISTVQNIADSDAIITIINGTNSLLDVLNKLTSKLGSIGSIGLGAFAFINRGRSNTILPFMVVMPCCEF